MTEVPALQAFPALDLLILNKDHLSRRAPLPDFIWKWSTEENDGERPWSPGAESPRGKGFLEKIEERGYARAQQST
jgi:hypothetical protein